MGNPVTLTPWLCTVAKTATQAHCRSTTEMVQMTGYMYTVQYFSTIKKSEIMPKPATGEKIEMIILSEVRNAERDKYQ